MNIRETLKPSATNVGTIYTSKGNDVVSGIVAANDGVDTYIWVYIVPSGGTADTTNMIIPGVLIKATETKILAGGITPINGDTIQVKSTSGNVIFHLFGDKQ